MNKQKALQCFRDADIYAITSEAHSLGRSNVDVVRMLISSGVTILQYREKEKSARDMYAECKLIREVTRDAGVLFIVNDRVDLALAVGADGVHIGQTDLPVEQVRQLVGSDMIIGLSTHSPEEAHAAANGLVDYIGVGPVFGTATKPDAVTAVGLDFVRYVADRITLPFVVIGGIKENNIAQVRRAGATVFAIISDIVGRPDINAAVRSLRQQLSRD